MAKWLGNIGNKSVLDFGSGPGRSSNFLIRLGAKEVIGVDHSPAMIRVASSRNNQPDIHYQLISDNEIPFSYETIDAAISTHVFMEIRNAHEVAQAFREIHRVLKQGSRFILVVTNPHAAGHDFKTYKLSEPMDGVVQVTFANSKLSPIYDTHRTEDEYRKILKSAGFKIEEVAYPKGENEVAPDMMIKAIKAA